MKKNFNPKSIIVAVTMLLTCATSCVWVPLIPEDSYSNQKENSNQDSDSGDDEGEENE